MTIAKMEMTMLLNYLALWNDSKSTKEYHVQAFSADTRGFIVVIFDGELGTCRQMFLRVGSAANVVARTL